MPLSDLWSSEGGDADQGQEALDPTHSSCSDLPRLRNQCRTFKARMASLLSRQKTKLERERKNVAIDPDVDAKTVFQQKFLASAATQWDPLEDTGASGLLHNVDEVAGRRRAVYSYFKALGRALVRLFRWEEASPTPISHVISINTNDDTNVKLGSGARGSTEVRSVMNNLQEHIVISDSSSSSTTATTWFAVHQPIVTLERPDTHCLYSEFMSWVLGWAGFVGWRLQVWGVPRDLFKCVRRHTFCFIGDAVRVNDSLFKYVCEAVTQSDRCQGHGSGPVTQSHAFQIHCGIHQVALVRKTIALGFPGYWSNLVRLGHLYESHSFRQRFKAALSAMVASNFQFVEVCTLPEESIAWNSFKIAGLQLHQDVGKDTLQKNASFRLRTLLRLLEKDNGNPHSDTIFHFCTGSSCCVAGRETALSTIINCYLDLFSHMPVPLLYRWKHAPICNSFIQDGHFLHKILPRTLASMPQMKCHLACLLQALLTSACAVCLVYSPQCG